MTSNLYQDVFPLVCTRSVEQTLKIPKSISYPRYVWHSSVSHCTAALAGVCGAGEGGRRWQASCLPSCEVQPPAARGGLGAPRRVCLV